VRGAVEKILTYNEEDLGATWAVFEWLRSSGCNLKRPVQTKKTIGFLTLAIWMGIFIAGLWPFNFVPQPGQLAPQRARHTF